MTFRHAAMIAVTAAAALAPGALRAQTVSSQGQVVATSPPATPAPPPKSATQVDTVQQWLNEDREDDGPLPDHKVHGEITVGVGTGGYREVNGVVSAPIGQTGEATVAIDAGQDSGGYWRR